MTIHKISQFLLRALGTFAMVGIACCASAAGAVTLGFVPNGSTSTTVGGSPISVNLVMTETGTTNISQFGVAEASFRINRTGAGTIGTIAGNNAFDVVIPGGADPSVSIQETSILGVGQGSNSVVLGTFLINATSAGSGALSVSAFGNPDDIIVYTSTGSLTLSPGIFSGVPNFNYTIAAVPEPSFVGISFLATAAGAWCMRRGKRRNSGAESGNKSV